MGIIKSLRLIALSFFANIPEIPSGAGHEIATESSIFERYI